MRHGDRRLAFAVGLAVAFGVVMTRAGIGFAMEPDGAPSGFAAAPAREFRGPRSVAATGDGWRLTSTSPGSTFDPSFGKGPALARLQGAAPALADRLINGETYLEWTIPERVPLVKGTAVKAGRFWDLLGDDEFRARSGLPLEQDGVVASSALADTLTLTTGVIGGADRLAPVALADVGWAANDRLQLGAHDVWSAGPEGSLRTAGLTAWVYPTWSVPVLLTYAAERDESPFGATARWQTASATAMYRFSAERSMALRTDWLGGPGAASGGDWGVTIGTVFAITRDLVGSLEYRHGDELPWGPLGIGTPLIADDRISLDVGRPF